MVWVGNTGELNRVVFGVELIGLREGEGFGIVEDSDFRCVINVTGRNLLSYSLY